MERRLQWESLINTKMGIEGISHNFASVEELQTSLQRILDQRKILTLRLEKGVNSPGSRGVINDQIEELKRVEQKLIAKMTEFMKDSDLIKEKSQ